MPEVLFDRNKMADAASSNNKLILNLPQLQNCIKRDASSYQEDFLVQFKHYESTLKILMFNPSYFDKEFESLVMFLAHTCPLYKNIASEFPHQLIHLLKNYSTGLHRASRMACTRALMVLRFKSFIKLKELLPLFFELASCQDKALRSYIRQNIINDVRSMNKKSRNDLVNRELQRFMYNALANHQQEVAAKMSLDIMTELYKKNVWTNKELVNQIAEACLSRSTKVLVTALQFFLQTDEVDVAKDSDDEVEDRRDALNQLKETLLANRFNKSTRKRQKILDRVKKTVRTCQNKEKKSETFNFSAIHLINDPQTLAERLLVYVEATSERFEVKLMITNFISRLIGIHKLILLNFYPYIAHYIKPHQTDVTRMLQYAAQSTHDDVPSNELETILNAITTNFVNEKNSTEAITVGLNSIREICARNPSVMNEDLLQDLVLYQKYKNKNVSIAAKSLVHLFRIKNPVLLQRRYRGRPTLTSSEAETLEDEEDVLMDISDDEEAEGDETDGEETNGEETDDSKDSLKEIVRLEDIERLYKKPKHNKESRLATVIEGRDGREKYGSRKPKLNEKSSTSNKDKKRNKAFGMVKHKLKRTKKGKTFHQKQLELKQKLLNSARNK